MRFKLVVVACFCFFIFKVSANENIIRARILELNPDAQIEQIVPSEIQNIYRVQFIGGKQLYVSKDVTYIFDGEVYKINIDNSRNTTLTNLTALAVSKAYKDIIDAIPESELIVFTAPTQKTYITVFTDISCAFCRKLHKDMNILNKMGVTVKYAAYPRNGMESEVASIMESVWCAKNKQKSLTDAKFDKKIEKHMCNNPVEKHFNIGRLLDISGTPTIFLNNGTRIAGYRQASELVSLAIKNHK